MHLVDSSHRRIATAFDDSLFDWFHHGASAAIPSGIDYQDFVTIPFHIVPITV
jgi:hypothetical protein